jgi:hypothetical protein
MCMWPAGSAARTGVACLVGDVPGQAPCTTMYCTFPSSISPKEEAPCFDFREAGRSASAEPWIRRAARGLHGNLAWEKCDPSTAETAVIHTTLGVLQPPPVQADAGAELPNPAAIRRGRARLRRRINRRRGGWRVGLRPESRPGISESAQHGNLAVVTLQRVRKRKTGVAFLRSPAGEQAGAVAAAWRDATPEGSKTNAAPAACQATCVTPSPPPRSPGAGA